MSEGRSSTEENSCWVNMHNNVLQVYQRAGVGFGRTDKPNRALDGTPKDSIKRRKLRRGKQTVAEAEEEASGPRVRSRGAQRAIACCFAIKPSFLKELLKNVLRDLQGLLLVGFSEEDTQRVRQWFATMEAGFPVSSCTDQLLGGTLKEAVTNLDGSFRCIQGWEKPQEKVPRAAFFSGMSNNETMGLAQYWESTGSLYPCPPKLYR